MIYCLLSPGLGCLEFSRLPHRGGNKNINNNTACGAFFMAHFQAAHESRGVGVFFKPGSHDSCAGFAIWAASILARAQIWCPRSLH